MRLLFVVAALLPSIATAEPVELTQQGRVISPTGSPIEGSLPVEVSLWSHATDTDDTTYREFVESFSDVALNGGYYSVILGTTGNLQSEDLQGDLWTQVSVDGQIMLPRTPMTSVPTAANGGADLSVFDGVKRDCMNGGEQVYDGTSGTWSTCPTVGTSGNPGSSCESLKTDHGITVDGMYWIDRDGAGTRTPFEAFCRMDILGGGWMLLVHIKDTSSATNFMSLPLPDCDNDTTACIERNAVNAGEMGEILVFDRINLDRWAAGTRSTNGVMSNLIDLVSTGNTWATNGSTTMLWYDGVSRTTYSHHANDGMMIDLNTSWNQCTNDSVSNVGNLCIACLRPNGYCNGQGKDTLFYVR